MPGLVGVPVGTSKSHGAKRNVIRREMTLRGTGTLRPLIYKFDECVYAIPWCFKLIDWIFRIAIPQRDADDYVFVVRYIEEFFYVILVGVDEADGAGGKTETLGDENEIAEGYTDRVFKSLRFLAEARGIWPRGRR